MPNDCLCVQVTQATRELIWVAIAHEVKTYVIDIQNIKSKGADLGRLKPFLLSRKITKLFHDENRGLDLCREVPFPFHGCLSCLSEPKSLTFTNALT